MDDTKDNQPADDSLPDASGCSGVRLYQITRDELADLELYVPELFTLLGEAMNHGHVRRKIQRVKDIICNVRWENLPWKHVERIE